MNTKNDVWGGCPLSFSPFKSNFELGSTSIIVGTRASGKTKFIINKIYRDISDKIDNLYIFSKGISNDTLYNQITDKIFVLDDWNCIFEKIKSEHKTNSTKSLVIFDDQNLKIANNIVQELIYNGRHNGITTILTYQYMPSIDFMTKEHIDYYIIQPQTDNNILKSLYEKYFGIFPTLDSYKQFNKCLKNWEFCVLNKRTSSKNILDIVSYAKTEIFDTHKKISSNISQDEITNSKNNNGASESDYKEILDELNETIGNLVGLRTKLKKIIKEQTK